MFKVCIGRMVAQGNEMWQKHMPIQNPFEMLV